MSASPKLDHRTLPRKKRAPSGRDQAIFVERHVRGCSQEALAKDHGLSQRRISQILQRVEKWRANLLGEKPEWMGEVHLLPGTPLDELTRWFDELKRKHAARAAGAVADAASVGGRLDDDAGSVAYERVSNSSNASNLDSDEVSQDVGWAKAALTADGPPIRTNPDGGPALAGSLGPPYDANEQTISNPSNTSNVASEFNAADAADDLIHDPPAANEVAAANELAPSAPASSRPKISRTTRRVRRTENAPPAESDSDNWYQRRLEHQRKLEQLKIARRRGITASMAANLSNR